MATNELGIQPTGTSVRTYAEDAVRAARAIRDEELDFDLAGLAVVDRILADWKGQAVPLDRINKSLYALGSYVGETVMRLQPGATWFKPEPAGDEAARLANLPFLAIRLADARVYRPINHAFLIMALRPMDANVRQVIERLLTAEKPETAGRLTSLPALPA